MIGLKEALGLLYLQVHDFQQVALLLNEPPGRDSTCVGIFCMFRTSDTAENINTLSNLQGMKRCYKLKKQSGRSCSVNLIF